MNSGWVLAVDFGTTNTAAAVRTPRGEVHSVRLSADADQMPSCVFDDGTRLVAGQAAAHQALLDPERFERSPKRRLGEPIVLLGQREWETADLVAAVLRHVVKRAIRLTGGAPVDRVVLTHPDAWGQQRCSALREAAARAGLPQVQLLSEPVAAAAWYLRADDLPTSGRVAVFDFGGGTCDVAVLHAASSKSAPLVVDSSAGEDHLGGDHIDAKLVNWVLQELRTRGEGAIADALADPDHPEWWLTLRDQVRGAKHALSEYPSAHVAVRAGTGSTTVLVTVEEFEKLIGDDVERAIALTRRVLDDARVADAGLAAFFCTGGSSHIPLVHRRLTQLLGRPPANLHDPKLVVALGAATTAQLAPPPPPPQPQPPGPPGPPRNLIARPSDGSVSLHFDPPVPEADRSPATAYRAIAEPGSATVEGPGSPLVVNGVPNGLPHVFRVMAANASGWGTVATVVATPGAGQDNRTARRRWWWALAAAVLAMCIGILAFVLRPTGPNVPEDDGTGGGGTTNGDLLAGLPADLSSCTESTSTGVVACEASTSPDGPDRALFFRSADLSELDQVFMDDYEYLFGELDPLGNEGCGTYAGVGTWEAQEAYGSFACGVVLDSNETEVAIVWTDETALVEAVVYADGATTVDLDRLYQWWLTERVLGS